MRSDDTTLIRIVKDDTNGMSLPASQATDSVPEVHTIGTASSLHRPMMHGEGHSIALLEGNDFGPRLHAWTLFGEDELASRKVLLRLGEQDRDLNWKHMLTVKILMETVIVPSTIL